MTCEICKKDKKLVQHHLSYEPEKTVGICQRCHLTLHNLSSLSMEQINILLDWIREYSDQWENGSEKLFKSPHRKRYNAKRRQGEKYKETLRKWREKNKPRLALNARRFTSNHPNYQYHYLTKLLGVVNVSSCC